MIVRGALRKALTRCSLRFSFTFMAIKMTFLVVVSRMGKAV